jgi:amino acid permease
MKASTLLIFHCQSLAHSCNGFQFPRTFHGTPTSQSSTAALGAVRISPGSTTASRERRKSKQQQLQQQQRGAPSFLPFPGGFFGGEEDAGAKGVAALWAPAGAIVAAAAAKDEEGEQQHQEEGGLLSVPSAACIVAGSMVGAGILALPSQAELVGCPVSCAALVGAWLYCLGTGMVLAESCAAHESDSGARGTSLQDVATANMGQGMGAAIGAVFFLNNMLLMVAYIYQAAVVLSALAPDLANPPMLVPAFVTAVLVAGQSLGGGQGSGSSPLMTNVGVALMCLSFGALVSLGLHSMSMEDLALTAYGSHSLSTSSLAHVVPVLLTSCVFQNVVPFVTQQLGGDLRKVFLACGTGSAVPLIMYISWSIVGAHVGGESSQPLLSIFSLTAISTSFWGATTGALHEASSVVRQALPARQDTDMWARSIVFVPPVVIATLTPNAFEMALESAGSLLDPFLFGLVPAFLAYKLRDDPSKDVIVPGGKPAMSGILLLTAAFMVGEMGIKFMPTLG